jgi:Domain of unknown function (DUF5659)
MEKVLGTSDLNICVILQYFNHQLVAVDKSNSSKCIFNLEKKEDTDDLLEDFYQRKLLVEPKRFVSIQKETKGRIYN